jgi:hypothetical protein
MNKILAALIAATFAAGVFAADAAKPVDKAASAAPKADAKAAPKAEVKADAKAAPKADAKAASK